MAASFEPQSEETADIVALPRDATSDLYILSITGYREVIEDNSRWLWVARLSEPTATTEIEANSRFGRAYGLGGPIPGVAIIFNCWARAIYKLGEFGSEFGGHSQPQRGSTTEPRVAQRTLGI